MFFCSVYRQYLIHNNENLSDDRVKFDDYQYSNVEGKMISNQSSKASSSQSKLIDTWSIFIDII
jgi:hypothetical protein